MSDEIRRSACSISNFNIADVACRSSFILCCLIIFKSKKYDFRDGVGLRALHLSADHALASCRHVALCGGGVARFADMQRAQ